MRIVKLSPRCCIYPSSTVGGIVWLVGGIKEKVLAAAAAGIKCVLLLARNRKDLDEVPETARQQLEFVFLDDVEQAARVAISSFQPQ